MLPCEFSFFVSPFLSRLLYCGASYVRLSFTAHTVEALLTVPMSKKRKRQAELEETQKRKMRDGRPPFPATHYILTDADMHNNNYPRPFQEGSENTQQYKDYVTTVASGTS